MKPILRYTLLLAIIICFITCKKDNNGANTTLPEATQEGKNTMGMKVNGEVWTPYSKCGAFADPCGAIDLEYNQPGSPIYYFSFHPARTLNGNLSSLIINTTGRLGITTIGNKFDSVNVSYNDYRNGTTRYTQSFTQKGNFTITKLDFTNQIISGTFGFTLYSGIDSIVISDGRFDCKFYTCICN